jgi:hypothetical protein
MLKKIGNGQLELADENYFSIDVGDFSAPQLFDLDKDGLSDLIIGEKNGNLNYYRNNGTITTPEFIFITDSLGKVNVTDYNLSYYGYSTPCFFRNEQGETELVVGSESGQIFYYKKIDGNLDGKFELSDNLNSLFDTTGLTFDQGIRTAAAVGDIKQDGKLEMIAGNFSGGLEYFNGYTEVLPGIIEKQTIKDKLLISPNPSGLGKINIDGLSVSGTYQFEIYTASGRLVQSGFIIYEEKTNTSVEILSLNAGIYLIRVFNSSQNLTSKFLVQ